MFRCKFYEFIERRQDKASMESLLDLFETLICDKLKYNYPELHDEFMEEFFEIVNEVTDEEIEMAVNCICKKDGTKGPKWTKDETTNVMHQFNVKERSGKEISPMEFWFAMNYAFAVHGAPNKTVSVYIDLALDEILDKNVCLKKKIRVLSEKQKRHEKEILK